MGSFLLYIAAIGFAFGIFLRTLFSFGLAEVTWILLLSFLLALIGRRNSSSASTSYILCVSVFLCLCALGGLRMEVASWEEVQPILEAQVGLHQRFEGTIVREPDIRENGTNFYVDIGEVVVLVRSGGGSGATYGDRVEVVGTLQKPEPFETDLGRTFDYRGYLQARGVAYILAFTEVNILEEGKGNPVIGSLLAFKHAFIEKIEQVIPFPQAGLAQGLLLGVSQALGDSNENAFRKTGITHIVVLSGYNIMLVILFVMYVLALVLPFRARLIVGFIAIVLFALLVGLTATVVRASAMASLMLLAQMFGRTYAVIRALVLTACAMLLFNPYLLVYDVGFQLSFIATLGLILLSPHLEKSARFMPKIIGLRGFFIATVATQLFVLPILLYQIGEFSVVSVVVNVLVLPMVPVAMLLTFTTGLIGFFSMTFSLPFAYLATWSLTYILYIANIFSTLPFASFVIPAFPFSFVLLGYLALGLLVWKLYAVHKKPTVKTDPLLCWVIEDESVVVQRAVVAPQKREDTPVPVFFR